MTNKAVEKKVLKHHGLSKKDKKYEYTVNLD